MAVLGVIAAVFFTMGGQNAVSGVAASSYPTAILATGIGWALGFGRIGQIAAPFAGGMLRSPQRRENHILFLLRVCRASPPPPPPSYRPAERRFGLAAQAGIKATERAVQSFRDDRYLRHNARRLEHLASLGLDLLGKRVLEVGAGVGDHTGFFLDRDCSVLSTEPRGENCQLFAETLRATAPAAPPRRPSVRSSPPMSRASTAASPRPSTSYSATACFITSPIPRRRSRSSRNDAAACSCSRNA